jgi:hypothetical protein
MFRFLCCLYGNACVHTLLRTVWDIRLHGVLHRTLFVGIYSCIFFPALPFWGLYLLSSMEGHLSSSWVVFVFLLWCVGMYCVVICGIWLLFVGFCYCIVSHFLVWGWMLLRCVVSCAFASCAIGNCPDPVCFYSILSCAVRPGSAQQHNTTLEC